MQRELAAAASLSSAPLFQTDTEPTLAVYALPAAAALPPLNNPVTFDSTITLRGYEQLPYAPGEPLRLLTEWQVEGSLPWDVALFVHLLGAAGEMVAQYDGLDAAASTLHPGDTFIQLHTIPLPDPLPAGPFSLQFGLYVRGDGHRLLHPGDPSDRVILATGLTFDAP